MNIITKELRNKGRESDLWHKASYTGEDPLLVRGKENSKPSIKIVELLHLLHHVMPH